jgi:hypothetical protein
MAAPVRCSRWLAEVLLTQVAEYVTQTSEGLHLVQNGLIADATPDATDGTIAVVVADFPVDAVLATEPAENVEHVAGGAVWEPFSGGRGRVVRVGVEIRLTRAEKVAVVTRNKVNRLATEPRSPFGRDTGSLPEFLGFCGIDWPCRTVIDGEPHSCALVFG